VLAKGGCGRSEEEEEVLEAVPVNEDEDDEADDKEVKELECRIVTEGGSGVASSTGHGRGFPCGMAVIINVTSCALVILHLEYMSQSG